MARGPGKFWLTIGLAAFAAAGFGAGAAETGAPVPGDLSALTEPLLARISEEESRNGSFSPSLVELLTSLGLLYQENGEHALAVPVLDRALYLKRVNDGLFGLEQAPLVRLLRDSELEVGRAATAAGLEERLLDLARRNARDPRAAPLFREAAERELDFYRRYTRGEIPPTFTFGDPGASQRAGVASLWRARRHYNEAMGALLGDVREHRSELAELEEDLTRTYYLEAEHRGRWYQGVDDPLYGLGVSSHLRRIGYAAATPVDLAYALVELADWSLLFSRNGTALKRYAEAYAVLVEHRAPAVAIEKLFPTATPVFLPAFAAATPGAAAVTASTGYVDVDFEVGKYGQPRRVQVVGAGGDGAEAISKDVVTAIRVARFRPSPVAGGASSYRLRYSIAAASFTPRL